MNLDIEHNDWFSYGFGLLSLGLNLRLRLLNLSRLSSIIGEGIEIIIIFDFCFYLFSFFLLRGSLFSPTLNKGWTEGADEEIPVMQVGMSLFAGQFWMKDGLLPSAWKMAESAAPGSPPSLRVGCLFKCSSISWSFSMVKLINKLILQIHLNDKILISEDIACFQRRLLKKMTKKYFLHFSIKRSEQQTLIIIIEDQRTNACLSAEAWNRKSRNQNETLARITLENWDSAI